MKVKKILVTTDLSEESRSAMEFAIWLSTKENSQITLLYCVDNLPTVAYHTVDLTFDKFREVIMLQEQKQLKKFVESSEKIFNTTINMEMIEGNASHEIVNFAAKNNFDLIVMNTHGRTGIQHAMLGSVAEKVIRKAPCPVLTIRSTISVKPKKSSVKK